MSEIKKPVAQEINDDELDMVAGGAYTAEEWRKLTPAERVAAKQRSLQARAAGKPCEMD